MEVQLGVIEARYADMIWEHEPVTSSELVKMTAVEFNWKRTTAHNVLRRLIDKGLFQNENGLVTSVISREDFYSKQSKHISQREIRINQKTAQSQRPVRFRYIQIILSHPSNSMRVLRQWMPLHSIRELQKRLRS